MRLKMSSGKWRPFCLDLNVIKQNSPCCLPVTSAPMNTYNREGTTNGLHLSVAAGHEDIVEGLLRAHTDLLEMQDEKGRTALHIAAIDDQVHMAQMLLDR